MREINEIVIHCSATRPDWMKANGTLGRVQEIARWHTARGWRAIGYHRLIDRDGTIANGRPIAQVGAHVKGHNKHSIGICLLGGFGGSADDLFLDHFTKAQDKALRAEIKRLRKTYRTITKVSGHHEYANKACPCFRVQPWLDEDRKEVARDERELIGTPFAWLLKLLGGKQ
jgi:N-acetylmuramoyl-L-alanine amidase